MRERRPYVDRGWKAAGERSAEVERMDRELEGLLSRFSELPADAQIDILNKVAELKERAAGNTEEFLQYVRELTEVYEAINRNFNKPGEVEGPSQAPAVNEAPVPVSELYEWLDGIESRFETCLDVETKELLKKEREEHRSGPGKRGRQRYKKIDKQTVS